MAKSLFKLFYFIIFLFSPYTLCMEFDLEEVLAVMAVWVDKRGDAIKFMEESKKSQSPKNYYESDTLKAIFDSSEKRVTLYADHKCYCIFYDHFLSGIEAHSIINRELAEAPEAKKSEAKKKCCIS